MPIKPSGKPNQRPEKPIDWELVDKLLESGCIGTEIASHFSMHPNTFYDRVVKEYGITFTEYSTQMNQKGEAMLKLAQYEKAIGKTKKGDTTLLTYLGRVRLKQKEPDNETPIDEEVLKRFKQMMNQLETLQSSVRKMDDSKMMSEQKS